MTLFTELLTALFCIFEFVKLLTHVDKITCDIPISFYTLVFLQNRSKKGPNLFKNGSGNGSTR